MQQAVVAVTTRVGVKGAFDVDLPTQPRLMSASSISVYG